MMATAPAETPTKINNCDSSNSNNSASQQSGSGKLVNGLSDHSEFGSAENNNAMKEGFRYPYDQQQQSNHRMNSGVTNSNSHHPQDNNKGGMDNSNSGPPPVPQEYPPPPPQQHQYQYPPYRTGYDQPPQHLNNTPEGQHPGYQHPGYPPQPPPMRFPGKPMPGGPSGGGQGGQVQGHSYPPGGMRGSYGGPGGGMTGQSISQQPSGPTPTLNQLLQSSGGANAGASGATPPGGHRYPPPGPPSGYEHPYPPHSKSDYTQGPTGWPPPSRPPINSYAHPPPPPFQQQQPQQPLYRQSGGGGGSRPPQPQQHPGQPYYQPPPGGMHHPGAGYPPPPPQSPHYPPPPHPAQQRYPSPAPGMRPPDNQPPSHYPGQLPQGMTPDSGGLGSGSGPSEGGHAPKSTPPPPPSPSLVNHGGGGNPPSPSQSPRSTPHPPPVSSTAANNSCPPSNSPSHRPQGSSPSNSYPPPDVGEVTGCNSNDSVGGANNPNNPGGVRPSPSPTGSASSRSMSPAVGNQNIPMPPRPSSSQSDGSNAPRMSQSPMPGGQGGSYPGQQPMAPPSHHMYGSGGKMAHGSSSGMIPPPQQGPGSHPPPSQSHYQQPSPQQQHWQHQQGGVPSGGQPGPGGYGVRPPGPGQHMMSPYPPAQQPMPGNSYPPPPQQRHPISNHVGPGGGPPGSSQYSPYPPQYPSPSQQQQQQQGGGQQGSWPSGAPGQGQPGTPPPPPNSRSHSLYLKQHLQQKLGFPPHGPGGQGGYPMGPPSSSNPPASSPSQTPPPSSLHHPGQHSVDSQDNSNSGNNSNPPNIVSVGPDGANVDDVSQQSTLSNASGASGGDDGPAMPKLRPEGSRSHGNYPSHPTTPQSNAVPSPGAASMSSAHEEYGEMNSPGWPRTPASPGLNSHPQPPSEHYRGKNKKADSLNKLYDMDDNPERRMFLDKLIHFMEDHNNPITSCPTISKNPLDLFKLYFLVKERGGFLEVTKNKTWKDIAGSLGIGASSSAAYTLRKHYTKHLLPFECKFDRGGIDPQPLINQVETSTKKKGKGAAPVPSPGSSNSQDSFPGPNNNTNSSSMDGFNSSASGSYPYGQPPSGAGGEYGTGGGPPGGNSVPPSPLSRPPPGTPGSSSSQAPQQHPGDKSSQISVSNPFDDMPQPANQNQNQYPHHYQQQANRLNYYPPYSTQPPSGYQGPPNQQNQQQGGPQGSYPPYSGSGGEQGYPGRPPIPNQPPHDGFPGPGQGYGAGQPGYPPPGGRSLYPPYGSGEGAGSGPTSGPGGAYPPHAPSSQSPSGGHVPPPNSQSSQSAANDDRYSMAPPSSTAPSGGPTNSYPPRGGPYPPNSSGGPQQGPPQGPNQQGSGPHPPPNGYPSQEYYNSQQTEQGYPGMGGQSGGPGGKHMPPPHPNQAMRYPPGKDGSPGGPYPGYPSQSQVPPQQRVPSYDGQGGRVGYMQYPPGAPGGSGTVPTREGTTGGINRSTPSPSPNVVNAPSPAPPSQSNHLPNQKQWIPPEGWPNYPGGQVQPRGYPSGGSAAPAPPHTQPQVTPAPAQSPGAPVSTPPQQAISPTPWGASPSSSGGPPPRPGQQPPPGATAQQGPPQVGSQVWSSQQDHPQQQQQRGFGPSPSGSIMSPPPSQGGLPPNANSQGQVQGQQPPWATTPTGPGQQQRRDGGRPPFPGGKPGEVFKGYGPSSQQQSIPPGLQQSGPAGPSKGQGPMVMPPQMGPQVSPMPPQGQFPVASVPVMATPPPPVQMKKEIVFPPESVEAVTPVLTRRRKLHKNDVAPLEAWRIMMCLKSGLLAETTWALDVLNVLLYDDHSVSYFSLTYLPGLLDILLEHLRRALILLFGQSIGIDMTAGKCDELWKPAGKQLKWYEKEEKECEEEPEIGMPLKDFPRDCHRVLVLQGTTNYTTVSRSGKKVKYVSKDDEPFVVPGPREWDTDEKSRNDPDLDVLNGTMDVTKHIVTYFSSDLNSLSIVRDLKAEEAKAKAAASKRKEDNKVVKQQEKESSPSSSSVNCTNSSNEVVLIKKEDCAEDEPEVDLEMYRCETKLANELVQNSNPGTPLNIKKENKLLVTENGNVNSQSQENNKSSLGIVGGVLGGEKKNCQLLSTPTTTPGNLLQNSKISLVQKKAKRLDDLLGRLGGRKIESEEQNDNDNAVSESPLVDSETATTIDSSSDNVIEDVAVSTPLVLENGCSDNALMEPSENSNLSAANSENTCDSSKVCKIVRLGELMVRDPGATLKRKRMEDYEDECYTRDESSLYLVTESQDSLARRCLSICNIIRNLTFVPGNDVEFGKCVPFLSLIGKLILLHHDHPVKGKSGSSSSSSSNSKKFKLEDGEETEMTDNNSEDNVVEDEEMEDGLVGPGARDREPSEIDGESCTSLNNEDEWWWDYVHHLREHVLVMIANISGQMDLSQFSEEISRPILDGLLHWAVCPAAYGQDPFPTLSPGAYLSPQRLAIEALCKLSVIQGNVDLLLATPPYSRVERLCQLLCRSLCRSEEQVMREFSLNLLFYLSAADSGVARTIALQNPCISLLISFIEQAEHNAMNIANNHGFSVLRENPEAMGTSLDMLRRAATTLLNLARHPDNRSLFVQHEPRLLQLVMSQILEQKVAAMVAQVLYQCSTPEGPNSGKYFYSSGNSDTFYTPSFSRSRSSQQPHNIG